MSVAGFDGSFLSRGDVGYETARRATVWNARTPDRYPDLIVRAAGEQDVVRAVGLARDEGMKIGVRSGGHSWAGNHVRDGGLLLDLSRLTGVAVDVGAMTATADPGCPGNELLSELGEQGLFGDGVVLRSRFWLGAALRPQLPAPLAAPGGLILNNRLVRRLALPPGLPRALALHCAEEYANLGALLPELYARFGSGSAWSAPGAT